MATEVKLNPGWLLRDVRSAAARVEPDHVRSDAKSDQNEPLSRAKEPSHSKPATSAHTERKLAR